MKSYLFNLLLIGLIFCQDDNSEKFILSDYLLIPFINDNYGSDIKIINELKGSPIDNYDALDYLDSKNLKLDELNEFHLRKLGKAKSHSWIYCTICKINSITGEKIYLY